MLSPIKGLKCVSHLYQTLFVWTRCYTLAKHYIIYKFKFNNVVVLSALEAIKAHGCKTNFFSSISVQSCFINIFYPKLF